MKLITFLFVLFTSICFGQNTFFGTIGYEEGLLLKVFYIEEPTVEFDTIPIEFKETIWHYSYNPFCFDCGKKIDTLDYGDTLYLPLNSYDRVWAETRVYFNHPLLKSWYFTRVKIIV